MLDKGQELDWFGSKMIVWCAVIAAAGFIAFLVRELVAAHPIVDLRIFKNRNFAIGNALMLLIGALLYATIAILPLFMQNLLHYTALAAGMAMTPFGIGAFTATIIVGRISGHISSGVGASSMYVPVATAAMGTLSQEQMGNAAGIFNLMRNIGGSIGIASITT